MPVVQFLIDHVGRHGLFFVKLTNLHSILSENKSREDNVITLLLPWPVNKSQMSARLKCANISYQLQKILSRQKDGQSMSARLKCANISYQLLKILRRRKDGQSIFDSSGGRNLEELLRFYNFKLIFSDVNGCSIVVRGTRLASQTP